MLARLYHDVPPVLLGQKTVDPSGLQVDVRAIFTNAASHLVPSNSLGVLWFAFCES